MTTTIAKLISLALLLTAMAFHTGTRARAGNEVEPFAAAAQDSASSRTDFQFMAIDLQENQTARIKAVLAVGPEIRPVEVEFVFTDKDGKVVASQKKTLMPGHSEVFEMRAGAIIHQRTAVQARLQIRGAIAPEVRKALVTSLEVTDSKGKPVFVKKNPRMVIGPEV